MRTELPHHPSNQEWINMVLGLPFASSLGRTARRISPQQGRKENAKLINRFRASAPIFTAMDTELSPASRTRASTSTCSRGLFDNMKDCSSEEPKKRTGLSNDGEIHSTVYRTPNRYHQPNCLWEPPPVTARPQQEVTDQNFDKTKRPPVD